MHVTTTKSKNSESFYITQTFKKKDGSSSSKHIKKLGTLADLSAHLHTDRDGVMLWAREQAKIETDKYKKENKEKRVLIPFYADRQLDYNQQKFYKGGYLFLQLFYYRLGLHKVCRKIKSKHKYEYDLNAILSDLVFTRILDSNSKRSSYKSAYTFLEQPSYKLHDIYRVLSVLAYECDFIQSEAYKNSHMVTNRCDKVLYYDCTNYYFEIQQEDGNKKYGKSKEHRPNPIIQMGLFTDGDGIPLAFSLFSGNSNEQTSLKPLEKKGLQEFECDKFIYCSDAGLGPKSIREFNHMGKRAFIVTQSIKKLKKEEKEWALNPKTFRRISDNKKIDISTISNQDTDVLYYKDEPYSTKNLHQRLIVTYSPKYAAYQKNMRQKQIERALKMIKSGNTKKQRKNQNDPARFISKISVTDNGEIAENDTYTIDYDKTREEEKYDGLYAICTDLLDDDIRDLIKISEGRWQIENCFRIMKTEFSARPVYVRNDHRIKAHFLVCFLSLLIFRLIEKKLEKKYTCTEILDTLKSINFAYLEEQGFMPLYQRTKLTDTLYEICCFRTDYQFISKKKMRTIQKESKGK